MNNLNVLQYEKTLSNALIETFHNMLWVIFKAFKNIPSNLIKLTNFNKNGKDIKIARRHAV